MSVFGSIEKLRQGSEQNHDLDGFDCGKEDLNRFLKLRAWASQQANSAQTYVLSRDLAVIGYYSLAASSVSFDAAMDRVKKGQARHSVPVILLARLAADQQVQRQGVGAALLKDALIRTASAATTVGARALLVHAQDGDAKGFYENFGFEPCPSDPYHLLLIMKDLQRLLAN